MARSLPSILVEALRRARAAPERDGRDSPQERNEEEMTSRAQYTPGAAHGAEVRKDGEKWTLVLVRDLPHPPAKVWTAITDPEHLREWAPFDSDRSLGAVGTVTLTTVGAPKPHVTESRITRAD